MNVVFDLGGVVVAYDRAALLAELYTDPATHAAVSTGIDEHLNWTEMDRGTLAEPEAIWALSQAARAASGMAGGLREATIDRAFLPQRRAAKAPAVTVAS